MNIQNIVSLAAQLTETGFEEMSSLLLKRICFKPENFTISSIVVKGKEQMICELYFEKDKNTSDYVFKFYDAILQKETPVLQKEINDIDSGGLEKQMKEINWKAAFDLDIKKQWSQENKHSWENEAAIESIVESLLKLEANEEGKVLANGLRQKYWSDISAATAIVNFNNGKNKPGISQRFYFFEGQSIISIDEAYRFLQNKWLEKQMQIKRKQPEESADDETVDAAPANGGGLLRKKRIRTKTRKLKSESRN